MANLPVELSEENKLQLFIPQGFAHGFVVLSAEAEFFYKCDNFYYKPAEIGILYNDPDLNINWRLPAEDLLILDRDKQNLFFAAYQALTV